VIGTFLPVLQPQKIAQLLGLILIRIYAIGRLAAIASTAVTVLVPSISASGMEEPGLGSGRPYHLRALPAFRNL
jgi:hypothetical protein